MKLYIKQRVFSWGDKFDICNEKGDAVYRVRGDIISIGKKLRLYNKKGDELGSIHQKLLTFLPRYYISQHGRNVAEVVKELSLFSPKYRVDGPGWDVKGDFFAHEYKIESSKGIIAGITKKWISFGDSYEVDIQNSKDEVLVISVVLVIDAMLAAEVEEKADANNNSQK